MKDAYVSGCERLDALARALAAVSEEFIRTKEAAVAAAGHVLCSMILRQLDELDRELDSVIKKTGI